VSEGTVGWIAVVQVAPFAIANVVLPRLFAPTGRILRIAAAGLVLLNLLSIVPTVFGVLLALRFIGGFAAGALVWITYTDAMEVRRSMAAVAAAGPTAVLIGSPVLGVLAGLGDRPIYLFLAVATIPAVLLFADITGDKRTPGSLSRSRSNRVLLAVLMALTFFGSALFINEALVARDLHGLSTPVASIAFSLNAAGGLAGARLSTRHRQPGWWLLTIGPAAFLTVNGPTALFFVGMAWWGFAFWMGVPGVLQMLAARSLGPSERAGDAQALMAVGRSLGPAVGGAFVDAGALVALSYVSAAGLALTGASVIGVQEGRDRLPATDPRTVSAISGSGSS
jgi:DHA1 family inner membrane transport protein